jgi:hypothetical protein
MIVLWSCRDRVDPGLAAIVGYQRQGAAMNEMQASATGAKPHGHEGQTRKKFF